MSVVGKKIMLFRNQSDNAKAPMFTGMIQDPDNGYSKMFEIALWPVTDRETGEKKLDSSGKPYLSGTISEPYDGAKKKAEPRSTDAFGD